MIDLKSISRWLFRFFWKSLLFAGAIILALLICEMTLRFFNYPYQYSPPPGIESRLQTRMEAYMYYWTHASYPPGTTVWQYSDEFATSGTMDAWGYLGTGQSNPAACSMIVFGDSFAYGYGVEPRQAFAGQLGAYNAGIWGVSFPEHARVFERLADRLHPRVAVWTIYPPHLISATTNGWNTRRRISPDKAPFLCKMISGFNKTRLSGFILASTGWGMNRDDYFTPEWSLYDLQDSTVEEGYRVFEQTVSNVVNVASRHQIRIIPLLIPSKTQLLLSGGQRPLRLTGQSLNVDLPMERLSRILTNGGIPKDDQVSLFEIFKGMDWKPLYFLRDAHWNSQGHHTVAEYLKQKLRTR